MAADDDRCEHLLAGAKAAATLPEPFRRRAILGIIEERLLAATPEAGFQGEFPDDPGPIEPFILAAYPAIERFWRAWLYDPLSANELIHLLATTAATGVIDRQRCSNLLRRVVERYPGDTAADTAATVVRWLADHPDAEELLPPPVIAYLNQASDGGVRTTVAPPREGVQQPEPAGLVAAPDLSAPGLEATKDDIASAAAEEPPLARAQLSDIELVLDELHDKTIIATGFKPPTRREAGQRGQRLLLERGQYATASKIEEVARKSRYAEVRLKRGETLESYRRKIASQIAK